MHCGHFGTVGMMAWAHGHAWELPEPLPQGWVVLIVAPTVFAAGAISTWRTRETGVFIGLAAIAVIFSACRIAFTGQLHFHCIIVAQQPARSASQSPLSSRPQPTRPLLAAKFETGETMTVTTGKGKHLAPEPLRDNAKDGSKPERPTIATYPGRPAAILAAALGLEQIKFEFMLSLVVAAVFELAMFRSLARAMDLWPTGDEPPHAQTEALSMALQLFGLMTWMQGTTLAIGSRSAAAVATRG